MRLASIAAVVAMTPIVVFTASAVSRLLQPLPNQPAEAEQRIFDWFAALSAPAMALAFFVLPLVAVRLAAAVLWRGSVRDASLRADTREALVLGWRFLRRPLIWLSTGVLLVGAVLALGIVIHGIAG